MMILLGADQRFVDMNNAVFLAIKIEMMTTLIKKEKLTCRFTNRSAVYCGYE